MPAPHHLAIARASSSCRGLPGESPTPGKSGPRFAYWEGSSFFSHQFEQPRCIDALICSIKPPSDLNKKASTFLAEGVGGNVHNLAVTWLSDGKQSFYAFSTPNNVMITEDNGRPTSGYWYRDGRNLIINSSRGNKTVIPW